MLNTESRLLEGAKLYYSRAKAKIESEMRNPPSIRYPEKITRNYFNRVEDRGKGEYAAVFFQRTFYKKIERYRQVNNVKYPIYSAPLWKDKEVAIKIRPNPSLFNELKNNDNSDLAKNAMIIISCFADPKLYPSWAQEEFLSLVHSAKSKEIADKAKLETETANAELSVVTNSRAHSETELASLIKQMQSLEAAMRKRLQKAIKSGFHQHKYLATVFSLGLASPKRKAVRSKKKASSLQRELTSVVDQYEESLIAYKKNVEREATCKDALSQAEALNAYAKELEDAQYAFDKSNIHQPFIGAIPPQDPPKPTWPKAELKYNYQTLVKEPTGDMSGFAPFDDPSFTKYIGFEVVGVLVIHNKETNAFMAGVTLDVGASLTNLAKAKKGRYHDKEMRSQAKAAHSKTDLFEVLVLINSNKDSLLEQLENALDAYRAHFVVI